MHIENFKNNMLNPKWLSRIILFILTTILTSIWGLNFIPILLPQGNAQDINNSSQIHQNYQNPQNLLSEGKRLYDTEKFAEAISVLIKAAQIFQSQGNQIQQAIALSNLSLVYKQIGEYQQALNYIKQSRELLENQLNLEESKEISKIFAQTLDIQANLQLKLGKPLLALDNWKQATTIYERLKLNHEKIRSLINQSIASQALGRYPQASNILEALLTKINSPDNTIIKTIVLRNLGDTQLYLGEIQTALKTLKESYEIAQKTKSNTQIASSLLSLGNAEYASANRERLLLQKTTNYQKTTPLFYTRESILPKARQLYQKAAQTYEKVTPISTSPTIQIKAQLNLLDILIKLDEFSKASKLSSKLILTVNTLPISNTSLNARINLSKYLLYLKQVSANNAPEWEEIIKILRVTIKQAEIIEDKRLQAYSMGILGHLYLQTNKLSHAQQITKKALNLALEVKAKPIAYLWQWQLGYTFKTQDNITDAIDYYSQAVNNLNDLRGDLVLLNPDIQFSFRDGVEPVYRELVNLLLQPSGISNISQKNLDQQKSTQRYIKQARDVIEALQLREIENYFREACLKARPEIIDTIIDNTDTKAAVIYPIILQDRLEIILKLPLQNKFNHYTTFIEAKKIEETLEKLQYNLKQPEQINQIKIISAELYSWLIEPLEADLQKSKIETLVFVLDGTLRNIPMAVLYDNKAQAKEPQYLIEKYAIVLTPGLQMLDPKSLKQQNMNALIAGVSQNRTVENKNFNSLNNVQIELQKIQSQISNSKKLLNQSFTGQKLEQQIDSAKYTIAHLATHANFSSNLEETYILTWNKLLRVREFDKLFQIDKKRDFNAIQLLVLSACETADGDKRAALGLSGVAIRAGARSTLATLWAVKDNSTAQLMIQFYQELQNDELNKAKALQKAQINLIRKNKLPLFWAPYVLVGNWL